ncbi:MAG: DUF3784 domain-containing protein [Ruminococcus sp.]|nr:DUF3784 domain-containing protein [Ruminococcus sp.]
MTTRIVFAVIMFVLSAVLTLLAVRSLICRGYCFNNAYIWASEQERREKDLTPYYRQSGVVFLMLALTALLEGLYILVDALPLMIAEAAVFAALMVYAVRSSVCIERSNKDNTSEKGEKYNG